VSSSAERRSASVLALVCNVTIVQRVAVIGPVASGKSTMARTLSDRFALPVHDLDAYYWAEAGPTSATEWTAIEQSLAAGDRWVIAGDYRATAAIRVAAADTVIWLDLSPMVCTRRAIARRLRGGRAPLTSCLRWIWGYPLHGRHETPATIENIAHGTVLYRLRTPTEVDEFLST
jgi:hypothetical protein